MIRLVYGHKSNEYIKWTARLLLWKKEVKNLQNP